MLDRRVTTRPSRDGSETITEDRIRYRFTPSDGAERTAEALVSHGFHDRLAVGCALPVRYLPDAPSISRIETGRRSNLGIVFPGLAG